jgi:hypothetical protein
LGSGEATPIMSKSVNSTRNRFVLFFKRVNARNDTQTLKGSLSDVAVKIKECDSNNTYYHACSRLSRRQIKLTYLNQKTPCSFSEQKRKKKKTLGITSSKEESVLFLHLAGCPILSVMYTSPSLGKLLRAFSANIR